MRSSIGSKCIVHKGKPRGLGWSGLCPLRVPPSMCGSGCRTVVCVRLALGVRGRSRGHGGCCAHRSRASPGLNRSSICQDVDLPALFPRIAAALGAAYPLAERVGDTVPLFIPQWSRPLQRYAPGLTIASCARLDNTYMRKGQVCLGQLTKQLRASQSRGYEPRKR